MYLWTPQSSTYNTRILAIPEHKNGILFHAHVFFSLAAPPTEVQTLSYLVSSRTLFLWIKFITQTLAPKCISTVTLCNFARVWQIEKVPPVLHHITIHDLCLVVFPFKNMNHSRVWFFEEVQRISTRYVVYFLYSLYWSRDHWGHHVLLMFLCPFLLALLHPVSGAISTVLMIDTKAGATSGKHL